MTAFLTAFAVSLVAVRAVVPVLVSVNLLDVPNQRSSHGASVPRGGGIGALVGVVAGVTVGGLHTIDGGLVILLTVVLLAAMGLVDDVRGLPALVRLSVQVLVCALAGALLTSGTGVMNESLLAIGATLWLVGFTNVFNFMDGINGISALSAAVSGCWYAWLGVDRGMGTLTVLGLAVTGSALGFLPWNAIRPRVFLGDVGSYGVGVLLALMALVAFLDGASLVIALAPLLVYLADTAWALTKRVKRGESWREAHREHVYQRLVDEGHSHVAIAILVAGFAAAVCAIVGTLPLLLASALSAVVLVVYLSLPKWAGPRVGQDKARSSV